MMKTLKKAVTIVFKSWSTAKYFLKSQSGEGWALRSRELPVFRAPRKSVKVLNGHWKQIVEKERGWKGEIVPPSLFLVLRSLPNLHKFHNQSKSVPEDVSLRYNKIWMRNITKNKNYFLHNYRLLWNQVKHTGSTHSLHKLIRPQQISSLKSPFLYSADAIVQLMYLFIKKVDL